MDSNFLNAPYRGPGSAKVDAATSDFGPSASPPQIDRALARYEVPKEGYSPQTGFTGVPPPPFQSYGASEGYAAELHRGNTVQPDFMGAPVYQDYRVMPPATNPIVNMAPAVTVPVQEHVLLDESANVAQFELPEAILGYENACMTATALSPPGDAEVLLEPSAVGQSQASVLAFQAVTELEARDALFGLVNEHCCYGSTAARELVFRALRSNGAFHYILETFTESRSSVWSCQPYTGQVIDGPESGPAPDPWTIFVDKPPMFTDSQVVVEVPHTACVKGCGTCNQLGQVRCGKCNGTGKTKCGRCYGRGRVTRGSGDSRRSVSCSACSGSGKVRCSNCSATGRVTCKTCTGFRWLKCYVALIVDWKVNMKDHVIDRTAIPDNFIQKAAGNTVFEEQMPRVRPIIQFPDQAVNDASQTLVDEHSRIFPLSLILMQRHKVRGVPITEAFSSWRNKDIGVFYVYGLDNRVYAPDYPQKICWGCTVV